MHIPASLIPKVTAARASSGRSNGELVIAALEQAHARLGELMGERTGTGGTLFATRVSRPGRATDGPLTALNIRLYDDDYAVIDQLVEKSGASSRGQLVSIALTDYLRD